jgi:hypothetical protein
MMIDWDYTRNLTLDSVWDWDSVGGSVWNSVGNSVSNSVSNSVWNSVGDSVREIEC